LVLLRPDPRSWLPHRRLASPVEAGCVDAYQRHLISRVLRRSSGLEVLLRRLSSWPAVVARWRSAVEWFAGGAVSLGRPWWRGRVAVRGVFFDSLMATAALAGDAAPSPLPCRPQRRWSTGLGGGVLLVWQERLWSVLLRRLAVACSAAPAGIHGVGHHLPCFTRRLWVRHRRCCGGSGRRPRRNLEISAPGPDLTSVLDLGSFLHFYRACV
jgi:hypothetical protein